MTKPANWLPRVFHNAAPPAAIDGGTIDGEAVCVQDTLDGIAADVRRARIEERHAEELLRYRREARENAERRWHDAKAEQEMP